MLPQTNLPYRTTAAYRLSVVKADWRIVRTGALIYELNPVSLKKEMKELGGGGAQGGKKKRKKSNVDRVENLYSRIVVPPTFWGAITLLGRCAAWLPNLC